MSALDDDIFADLLGGPRSSVKPTSPAHAVTRPDASQSKYPEVPESVFQPDAAPAPEPKRTSVSVEPVTPADPIVTISKPELEALVKATVQSALDDTFGKFAKSLRTVLEDMSRRIESLSTASTHNTQKLSQDLGSLQDMLQAQTENTQSRFTNVDVTLKDLERGVQSIRDKQELVEAQSMLAKFSAAPAVDKTTSTVETPKQATQQQSAFAPAVQPAPAVASPAAAPAPQPQPQPQPQLAPQPQPQPLAQPPQQQVPLAAPLPPQQPALQHAPPPPQDLQSQYSAPPNPQYQYSQPPPTSQPHMDQYSQPSSYPPYSHAPPPGPSGPPMPLPPPPGPAMHALPHAPPAPPVPPMPQPSLPPPPPPPQPSHPPQPMNMPPPPTPIPPPQAPTPSYPTPYPAPPSYPTAPVPQMGGFRPGPPNNPPPSGPPPGAPRTSALPIPLDQVIHDITNMGFDRGQVMNVVNMLQKSGQSIDLNVILDRLMRGGA